MGFFSSSNSSSQLTPLSLDRIKQVLESMDLKYVVDDDGDIAAGFEDCYFYFFVRGENQEILQVRGSWFGALPEDRHAGLSGLCEQWNRDKIWPKVYPIRRDDTGLYSINSEHTIDYEHGVTDSQIRQHLECAIGTSNQFFARAFEVYPEARPEETEETKE